MVNDPMPEGAPDGGVDVQIEPIADVVALILAGRAAHVLFLESVGARVVELHGEVVGIWERQFVDPDAGDNPFIGDTPFGGENHSIPRRAKEL